MYNMKYTFLDIFNCMLLFYSTHASHLIQIYHRNILDGHICQGNEVAFTTKGSSAMHCAYICMRHELCLTWFFGVQHCIGCSKTYSDTQALLVAEDMVAYSAQKLQGEMCNTDEECKDDLICFTDKCVCVPGYYYDPNTKTCTTECTIYGDTYQDYANRYIRGYNMYSNRSGTLENCKALCTKTDECRSLDYYHPDCNLASATALSQSNYLSTLSTAIYSQRNCG